METRQDELDLFKRHINLSEFAANYGYALDKRESSRNSATMRNAEDDKIIIARSQTQHYIYFSRRDDNDNGTIIDFIQNRTGKNLGEIRKELRPWIGDSATVNRPAVTAYQNNITVTMKDRQEVIKQFSTFKRIDTFEFFSHRGISQDVVTHPRFNGRIFRDRRRNAIFPHFDEDGLCGYEAKNKDYTAFAKGGKKTAWVSQCFKKDAALVITESAIEALSHFSLFNEPDHRYISVGGSWSEEAEIFTLKLIERFNGETVVLAFNNDRTGHEMADKMKRAIGEQGLDRFKVLEQYPDKSGQDWNDMLNTG